MLSPYHAMRAGFVNFRDKTEKAIRRIASGGATL